MKELLLKLFTSLGVSDDVIAVIKEGDETKITALKPEELSAEIIDIQKGILSEDQDFLKPVVSETIMKFAKKRESQLPELFTGLITKAEIEALPEKNRFDEAMKIVARNAKKSKSGENPDDKDKKIDELLAEIAKKDQALEEYETVKLPGVRSEYEGRMTQREIDSYIRNQFRGIEGKLVADADLLYPGIESELKRRYDFKREDDGSVVMLEKGKTTKATKNSKSYAIGSALEDIADEKKAIRKSEDPLKSDPLKEKKEAPKFNLVGNQRFQDALAKKKAESAAS